MADCNITNFANCLPEIFLEFLLDILKSPLNFLLNFIRKLLVNKVDIGVFLELWLIIVYIISLFYGLFFLYAGFNFIISGHNVEKRQNAKSWIFNIVLMLLFVQSSYFLYDLIIDLESLLTSSIINLIDINFFVPNVNNLGDVSLQIVMIIPYLIIIISTILLLCLRYILINLGVVLFPIGLFFYFIPVLNGYGKLIINILISIIFVNFFNSIILLGSSKLMNLSLFNGFNILIPMSAFLLINFFMLILIIFGVLKGALSVVNSDAGRIIKKNCKVKWYMKFLKN